MVILTPGNPEREKHIGFTHNQSYRSPDSFRRLNFQVDLLDLPSWRTCSEILQHPKDLVDVIGSQFSTKIAINLTNEPKLIRTDQLEELSGDFTAIGAYLYPASTATCSKVKSTICVYVRVRFLGHLSWQGSYEI